MRRIVAASLRFRSLVVFAAIALLFLGFAEIPGTKVDVFPEFAPPRVEIQTIALGNSSNEVEQLITVPDRGPAQRDRGPGSDAVQVGGAAVLHPAHLRRAAPTSSGHASW